MFQGSNTNKLDLAVELDTERGRELFLDLVDGQRRGDRQLQPARARAARSRPGRAAGAQPAAGRAARAGVRRRRSVARAARVRAHHRGAVGDRVDHRVPRPGTRTAVGHRRRAGRRARDRSRCCSRSSTATAPDGACSSSARWSARRSTSPPSRWSSTRRTGGCSNGAGTAARPRVPQGVYRTADIDRRRHAGPVGRDLGRRRRPVARVCGIAVLGWSTTRARDGRRARATRTTLDAALAEWCATPHDRRHRRARCRAQASRASPWCAPTSTTGCRAVVWRGLFERGRAPGDRRRRLHRRAVPSRQRPARPQPSRPRRCSASTTATCSPASSA